MPSRCGLILCAILAFFTLNAAAQSLGPPLMLPGDAALAPAVGRQESPQISRGANGYLVVWSDNRTSRADAGLNGPYFGNGLGNMLDIYAARLDLNGNLVNTTPFVISQAPYNQSFPRVAWNGSNWLVAWMTENETDRYHTDVMATRVSPAGVILDNPPILVDASTISYHNPWGLSSDGTNWVVTWRDLDVDVFTVDGARISPTGVVLDPAGKRLRRDFWNSGTVNADIAFAGDEYLLVFEEVSTNVDDGWILKAQRLSLSLDPLGPVFQVNTYSPTDAHRPSVASNGTDFLVVWFEDKWYGWAQLYGARVSHNGTVLDPNGIVITDYSDYTLFEPDVVFDGTNYIIAHNRFYDVYTTRVTPAGSVVDPNGTLVKSSAQTEVQPSIAAAPGGGAHLAWSMTLPIDIVAAHVAADGTPGPDQALNLSVPRQSLPRMVATADGYLVVFRSETSELVRILAHRLDAAGNPLAPEPSVVAAGPNLRGGAVAWNGLHYYFVWENPLEGRGQVYGRRMAPDGTFPDSPVPLMVGNEPDVAALGTTFLVVDTYSPFNHQRYTQSVRVDANGAVLGSPVPLGANFDVAPRVAAVGNRWLAVWEQNVTHDNVQSRIVGAFVNADGTSAGRFDISDGQFYDDTPHLAPGSSSTLIAWEDDDIFGRRILPDGTLLDSAAGVVISNAPQPQFFPMLAWEGIHWLVNYIDQRNEPYPVQPRGDVFATRVDLNGVVMDPNGFAVAASTMSEDSAAVAARNGSALFSYSTYADPQATLRMAVRAYSSVAVPTPDIAAAPNPLAFGMVGAGGSAGGTVMVSSTGTAPLAISSLIAPPSPFSIVTDGCSGQTLAVGDSCSIDLSFSPAAAGMYSAGFTIQSNDPDEASLDVALTGEAVSIVLTAAALAVLDGSVNGIIEPGESAEIRPSWHNGSALGAVNVMGTAVADGSVVLTDALAAYGTAPAGETRSCVAMANCYGLSASGPRPGLHWDVTLSETVSTGQMNAWSLHVGGSFSDVPPTHPFARFVETILHKGITAGCSAGNFCPDLATTRAQMAVFLLRATQGSQYQPPPCTGRFADVPCPGGFADWIEDLYVRGITAGCGTNPLRYCPNAPVTRAQMAIFLLVAKEGTSYTPPACSGIFKDVPCSSGLARWIEELFRRGITAGCSTNPSRYCPSDAATRGQMSVFLTKTFALQLYAP